MKWFKKPEKIEVSKQYIAEPLSERDRQDLVAIHKHPGYAVVLKVMEQEAEVFTTALINAASDEEILQAQRLARAAWQFYQKVQKRIDFEVNEQIFISQEREVNA